MIKKENQCVGCDLPCLYHSCPYYEIEVPYCDTCGDEADYHIEDNDYCEECAKSHLTLLFTTYSIAEQAEILDLRLIKY